MGLPTAEIEIQSQGARTVVQGLCVPAATELAVRSLSIDGVFIVTGAADVSWRRKGGLMTAPILCF